MQLVKVDIVGFQPLQALVHRLAHLRPVKPTWRLVFSEPSHRRAPNHLGRKNDLVPVLPRRKPCADDFLGPPLRLRLWRNGVKLRGVEEIHAARDGVVHLLMALGFGVLLAPGHGAEADQRNVNAGAAEFTGLHDWTFGRRICFAKLARRAAICKGRQKIQTKSCALCRYEVQALDDCEFSA